MTEYRSYANRIHVYTKRNTQEAQNDPMVTQSNPKVPQKVTSEPNVGHMLSKPQLRQRSGETLCDTISKGATPPERNTSF